jgi:hypothetical protein
MKNIVLPEFQEYLRSKSLVNANYIRYYAYWASKFSAFSKNIDNLSHEVHQKSPFDSLYKAAG